MTAPADSRIFQVRPSEGGPGARSVEAEGFEAAALAYAETLHSDAETLRLTVRDDAGRSQCFVVDLGSGEAAPC